MARTRQRKPTTTRAAPGGSVLGRASVAVLTFLLHPGRLAVVAIVLAALALRPTWARFLPNLGDDPAYRVAADEIHITPPPRPVPADLVERVLARAALGPDFSLLEESLLPRLAEAFSNEPWVKSVVRLRKDVPARIDVELEYRRPVAIIETADGPRPVAGDGTLLPASDFSSAEMSRYPRIVGAPSLSDNSSGDPRNIVAGATRVAAVLRPHWQDLGVTAIRIPRAETADRTAGPLIYALESRGGSRVIWGSAPGWGTAEEPTAGEKLERLRAYLASRGSLGATRVPVEIDLRPWQGAAVRGLSAGGEAAVTSR